MKSRIVFFPLSRTDRRLGVLTKTFCLSLGLAVGTNMASASDWTGVGGDWSSNADPGWNGTGVPNLAGAVADFGDNATTTATTTQDVVGGVIVGTISLSGSAIGTRSLSLTEGITMDQDGALAGTATISNSRSSDSELSIGSATNGGTVTLADDLLISVTNTSASDSTVGVIRFRSTIAGTGNVTISNSSPLQNSATGVAPIRLEGTNTFVGSVTIQNGLVNLNAGTALGDSANMVTLGSTGQNVALHALTGMTVANNWEVASGAGTVELGGRFTNSVAAIYGGTGTLNSNLTLRSESTGGRVELSGVISGTGGITKTGAGVARLSNANSYTGDTLVSAGTLNIATAFAIQNSALDTSGAGFVTLANTASTGPTFGGLEGSTNLATVISSGYSTVTSLTLNTSTGANLSYGGAITDGATGMNLTKSGAGTQTFTGTNTYTGNTTINDGELILADDAGLTFVLGLNGVSNKVTGAATATLNGDFTFNLDGAEIVDDGSWIIVDRDTLTDESFGSTFSVVGFEDNDLDDIWVLVDGNNTWSFDEDDGVLRLTVASGSGYSGWASINAPGQTKDQDHDFDGVENGIEYFMGLSGSGFTANPALSGGTVTWTKGGSYIGTYGTDFVVQSSTDLVTWTDVPVGTDPLLGTVADSAGSVTYTLPTGQAKRFGRLVVNN